jgi:hypothetical protein
MNTLHPMQIGLIGADILCLVSLIVIAVQSFQKVFDEDSAKPVENRGVMILSLTALIVNLITMIYYIIILINGRLVVRGFIPFMIFLLVSVHCILIFFAIMWQIWKLQGKKTLWIRENKRFIFAPLVFTTVISLVFIMFLEIPEQLSNVSRLFKMNNKPLPPPRKLKKRLQK